jgi:hypothetical protein
MLVKGSFMGSEKLKTISKDTGKSMDELIEDIRRREVILHWLQKHQIRNFKELGRIFEKYHERRGEFYNEVAKEMKLEEKKAVAK